MLEQYGFKVNARYDVRIDYRNVEKYSGTLVYQNTFGETPKWTNLLYLNSVFQLAIAKNHGNFAEAYQIGSGPDWRITIAKHKETHSNLNLR